MKQTGTINDPGVRECGIDTFVVQMTKRSEQLNGIADSFEHLVEITPNRGQH